MGKVEGGWEREWRKCEEGEGERASKERGRGRREGERERGRRWLTSCRNVLSRSQ